MPRLLDESDVLSPRDRAENALLHVSLFPATDEHKEAVIALIEVEIEAAIREERRANAELESSLFSLLEDYQGLVAHLLKTQQAVGPMSKKKGYETAMEQVSRINFRLAEMKARLGVR